MLQEIKHKIELDEAAKRYGNRMFVFYLNQILKNPTIMQCDKGEIKRVNSFVKGQ